MSDSQHTARALLPSPSAWVVRWCTLIASPGPVLDLACGSGRHALYLAGRGFQVRAVDRDPEAIAALSGQTNVDARQADLEDGPWPYPGEAFAGIIVANYLHRPLFPVLIDALASGGVLIYETFAQGNERFGRPSNPAFLLRPGELLEAVRGRLRVVAFEDVQVDDPKPAVVQRICAVRESIGPAGTTALA